MVVQAHGLYSFKSHSQIIYMYYTENRMNSDLCSRSTQSECRPEKWLLHSIISSLYSRRHYINLSPFFVAHHIKQITHSMSHNSAVDINNSNLETLTVSYLSNNVPPFLDPKFHYRVYSDPPLDTTFDQKNQLVSILNVYLTLILIL